MEDNLPITHPSEHAKKPFSRKKIWLIIIGLMTLITAAELFWVIRNFPVSNTTQPRIIEETVFPLSEPKMVLSSPKESYKVGERIPITIKVVTGGKFTDSTDVVIHFNPEVLSAPGSGFIQLGGIYQDYPVAVYDNRLGILRISGTTFPNQPGFSGIGTLATLQFVAKAEGDAEVRFEFTKGSTGDTNVVLANTAQDALSEVVNSNIIVSNTVSPERVIPSCEGYDQYCETPDGKVGIQRCQKGVLKDFQCKFNPSLTVSCEVCKEGE